MLPESPRYIEAPASLPSKMFLYRVQAGKIFTLLGRNGAGKTTFVRICATQLMPTSGTISGTWLRCGQASKAGEGSYIYLVPQEGRPLRALTPWDHVYNWLQIRGDSKQRAKDKTEEMLRKLEMYKARDRPAMNLSGGMKQKILVAMAMASDAEAALPGSANYRPGPSIAETGLVGDQGLEKQGRLGSADNSLHGRS